MRPKKVILYVDSNQQNLSILSFALATNGYRVLRAAGFTEALTLFSENVIDLVAVNFLLTGGKNGDEVIVELKKSGPHIPMVLFINSAAPDLYHADALLPLKTVAMSEILERFKVLSARKRGPRKGVAQVPRLSVASHGVA
jgi:CheY-like chemotaxis protein